MKVPVPLVAAAALGAAAVDSAADTDFTIGVNAYRLVTTARTWDNAHADAVAKGGNLVRIESTSENSSILSAIQSSVTTTAPDGGDARYAWIGAKETSEGTYAWSADLTKAFWSGGSAGSSQNGLYQNWGRLASLAGGPEPDNYQGTQNCGAMAIDAWPQWAPPQFNIGISGQWNDINHSNTLHYVIEWTPWQNWRKTHFTGADLTNNAVSGPAANPDNDGLTNLLEHAFGTNPKLATTTTAAESGGTIVSLGSPSVRVSGASRRILFARRKQHAAEGLVYTPSFSTQLSAWTPSAAIPTVLADNGTMQIVALDFPEIGGIPARFVKISVTMP